MTPAIRKTLTFTPTVTEIEQVPIEISSSSNESQAMEVDEESANTLEKAFVLSDSLSFESHSTSSPSSRNVHEGSSSFCTPVQHKCNFVFFFSSDLL